MSAQKSRSFRWPAYDLGLAALTIAFALPLVAYALIGLNMRYSGDDYCYAGLFRQQGFLRTITDTYTGPSPFHGNRVSLTISSGIADAVGPAASAILPTLVLVLWLGGLVLLFRGIAGAARAHPSWGIHHIGYSTDRPRCCAVVVLAIGHVSLSHAAYYLPLRRSHHHQTNP